MFTEIDTRNGIVKTSWSNIRERVKEVAPEITMLIDELSPDSSYPIFLAYYPYGELKGDTICSFIPNINGGTYRLSDPNAPSEIKKHLGYGIASSPFGMILEKNFEYYIDLKHRTITKPWKIGCPGSFFPIDRLFKKTHNRIYSPNGILSVTSGSRSTFLLPSISRDLNHSHLQRDFNISSDAPSSLYDQWKIFKEISNSPISKCKWRSCLLYFSEKWVKKILYDKSWSTIKTYLYEKAWRDSESDRTSRYYDIVFSEIKAKRNLKLNPYLASTARHILNISLGDAVGYSPQLNDNNLPIEAIQNAYIESYSLKNYWPTIIAPDTFNFERFNHPIYYSLQFPSVYETPLKLTHSGNTLSELRELKRIIKIYKEELSSNNSMCTDTVLHKASKKIDVNFFHNKPDPHRIVNPSSLVLDNDKRFGELNKKYKLDTAKFASDSAFLRGCIKISN